MKITRNELEKMDFSDVSDGTKLAPVHPGEVLLRDFMEPLEVTQYRLALTISVPPLRINEIVHHKRTFFCFLHERGIYLVWLKYAFAFGCL